MSKGLFETLRKIVEDGMVDTEAEVVEAPVDAEVDVDAGVEDGKEVVAQEKFAVTPELVEEVKANNPDLAGFDDAEISSGLEVEQEHADVTAGDPDVTAKIVAAHLKEIPDYYVRLAKMEADAKAELEAGNKPAEEEVAAPVEAPAPVEGPVSAEEKVEKKVEAPVVEKVEVKVEAPVVEKVEVKAEVKAEVK